MNRVFMMLIVAAAMMLGGCATGSGFTENTQTIEQLTYLPDGRVQKSIVRVTDDRSGDMTANLAGVAANVAGDVLNTLMATNFGHGYPRHRAYMPNYYRSGMFTQPWGSSYRGGYNYSGLNSLFR